MRFVDRLPLLALLLVGTLLAAGNLWFTSARTLIPFGLHTTVADLEIRHEKHPGFDDVLFLVLGDGRTLHVERSTFQAVAVGDLLDKRPFEQTLIIQGKSGNASALTLKPSRDLQGMQKVMPITLGLMLVLATVGWRAGYCR